MYLLLQFIKYLFGEELSERHIQTIAQFLYHIDGDLLAATIKHAIHSRRRDAGQVRKLVRPHISLFQYLRKPCDYRFFYCHSIISYKKMIEKFTQKRIRTCVILF